MQNAADDSICSSAWGEILLINQADRQWFRRVYPSHWFRLSEEKFATARLTVEYILPEDGVWGKEEEKEVVKL